MTVRSFHITAWPSAMILLAAAAGGCGLARTQQASLPAHTPAYTVELRPTNKKPIEITAALPSSITVQQALVDSKAMKKFKRMQVAVARKSNETGQIEYFKVPFDKKKRRIDLLHDYALQPGDRVVVIEDNGTVLTDTLEQLTEPLHNALGMDNSKLKARNKRPF